MTGRAAPALAAAVLVAACATTPPTPTGTEVPVSPAVSPEASAGDTPAPSRAAPSPGQPLDVDAVLAAMRESRRPGGVPESLQTDGVAAAIADLVWTVNGRPWSTMAIGASCGESTCSVELQGSHAGTAGEDAWVFAVDPATDAVTVTDSHLASLDPELVARLDRTAIQTLDLSGLRLTAARWAGPEAPERFVLAYRSGDEEGGCSVDVTLSGDEVVGEDRSGC